MNFRYFAQLVISSIFGFILAYNIKLVHGRYEKKSTRVIMFPDSRIPCRELIKSIKKYQAFGKMIIDCEWAVKESRKTIIKCANQYCKFYHSLDSPYAQLLLLMSSATSSLDVCMYSFSEKHFVDIIIYLHKIKEVDVRIITDEVQETGENSCINYLFQEGIPVIFENRYPRSAYFMHHKFYIVDKEILMVGSLNLTRTALVGNNESVICTSDKSIVDPFVDEFNRLWTNDIYDRCPVGGKSYKPVII